MALKSLAVVSENDAFVFTASRDDDPEAVRQGIRRFIAEVTASDHGKQPVVAIEGYGFDQPVPLLVLKNAHGLFPSSMEPLVGRLDISSSALHSPTRPADALLSARAMGEEYWERIQSISR